MVGSWASSLSWMLLLCLLSSAGGDAIRCFMWSGLRKSIACWTTLKVEARGSLTMLIKNVLHINNPHENKRGRRSVWRRLVIFDCFLETTKAIHIKLISQSDCNLQYVQIKMITCNKYTMLSLCVLLATIIDITGCLCLPIKAESEAR